MQLWLRKLLFDLRYFHKPPWDTGISPPELIAFIQSHPPAKALDLGCGTGTNAITLARHGWDVTGVDFSRRAIHIARRKARHAGVDPVFLVEDVSRLENISGKYDLILDIGCFHSLDGDEVDRYSHHVKRLLAENGTLLMYAIYKIPGISRPGLLEENAAKLSENLNLVQQVEGKDRGQRPSAWFTYQKSI